MTTGTDDGKIKSEIRQEIHDPKTGKIIDNVPDRTDGYTYYPNYRPDMNGDLFSRPTVKLPPTEYRKVMSAIAERYHSKYQGHSRGIVRVGKKIYSFEIRKYESYADFNVDDVWE